MDCDNSDHEPHPPDERAELLARFLPRREEPPSNYPDLEYPDPELMMQDGHSSSQTTSPSAYGSPSYASLAYGEYSEFPTESYEDLPSDNEETLMDDIDELVALARPHLQIPQDNSDEDPDFIMSQSDETSESDLSGDGTDHLEDDLSNRGGLAKRSPGRPRGSLRGRGRRRGTGVRGGQRGKRGIRKAAEPTFEFQHQLSQAYDAYITGRYDEATDLVQQAIHENPEMFAAHSLLSEIFRAQGKKDKAVAALFNAAHTRHKDPKAWLKVAKMILEMQDDDRIQTIYDVIYCYSRIIDINRKNHHMRLQRAALYREVGEKRKALKEYERVLKDLPHDTHCVRLITEICIETKNVEKAKILWQNTIQHYHSQQPHDESKFGWSDVNVYVELFGYSEEYEEGIFQLKRQSRWLLGREFDTQWEHAEDDDREFDDDDAPRRIATATFVADEFPKESYGVGLPLELRVKLGIYRLRLGHVSEAKHHFEWLRPHNLGPSSLVFDYGDLFIEVANGLLDAGLHQDALRFYQAVEGSDELGSDARVPIAMATCCRALGMIQQAEEYYAIAIGSDEKNIDARVQMATLLEEGGRLQEAHEFVNAAVILERQKIAEQRGRAAARSKRNLVNLNRMRRRVRTNGKARARFINMVTDARTAEVSSPAASPVVSPASSSMVEDSLDLSQDHSAAGEGNNSDAPRDLFKMGSKRKYSSIQTPISQFGHRETRIRRARPEQNQNRYYVEDFQKSDPWTESLHNKLLSLQDAMRHGDPDATRSWLDTADQILRDFRSNRLFYPFERNQRFLGYSQEAVRASLGRKDLRDEELERYNPELANVVQRLHETEPEASSSLPSNVPIPTVYRGIPFTTWLDIFLEYAFQRALAGDRTRSYATLTSASDANVFYHSKSSMTLLHVFYFTCALILKDEETLLNIARVFITGPNQNQNFTLHPEPTGHTTAPTSAETNTSSSFPIRHGASVYSILARLNAHSTGIVSWYNAGPNQKYLLRQIKAMDKRLSISSSLSSSSSNGGPTATPTLESSFDLPLVMLYGHILTTAGSYSNALVYYLRAYSVCPTHPVVLLSLALSYIHWALKRQSGNRHYIILQGTHFLYEYYRVRTQPASFTTTTSSSTTTTTMAAAAADDTTKTATTATITEKMEAEYNVGRVWHMLACTDLAIPHYERVLQLGREMRTEMKINAARRKQKKGKKEAAAAAINAAKEAAAASNQNLSVHEILRRAAVAFNRGDDGDHHHHHHHHDKEDSHQQRDNPLNLTPSELELAEIKIEKYRRQISKRSSSSSSSSSKSKKKGKEMEMEMEIEMQKQKRKQKQKQKQKQTSGSGSGSGSGGHDSNSSTTTTTTTDRNDNDNDNDGGSGGGEAGNSNTNHNDCEDETEIRPESDEPEPESAAVLECEDYSREAAVALSLIYVASGSHGKALEVTGEFLRL